MDTTPPALFQIDPILRAIAKAIPEYSYGPQVVFGKGFSPRTEICEFTYKPIIGGTEYWWRAIITMERLQNPRDNYELWQEINIKLPLPVFSTPWTHPVPPEAEIAAYLTSIFPNLLEGKAFKVVTCRTFVSHYQVITLENPENRERLIFQFEDMSPVAYA